MEIEKNDVNISFNNYLSKVNSLIMLQVWMKKLNKQQKFLKKLWFTTNIQHSIRKKNNFFKKYIKCQNLVTKNDLHREYQRYSNKLPTIIKESTVMIISELILKTLKTHGKA